MQVLRLRLISYIEYEEEHVLLGITVDSNLTFGNHIDNTCKRASQNLNTLARVAPYTNVQKRRIVIKFFVTSQFRYCPLIWMFHNRRLNDGMNSIHGRALRIAYRDHISTSQELLIIVPVGGMGPFFSVNSTFRAVGGGGGRGVGACGSCPK